MISFPGLGKEELGEEWGGKGGRGGEWHRGAHIKNAISREGERRLVMNYAPPNARVKLRNCPHEYTQGRQEGGVSGEGEMNIANNTCTFFQQAKCHRGRV